MPVSQLGERSAALHAQRMSAAGPVRMAGSFGGSSFGAAGVGDGTATSVLPPRSGQAVARIDNIDQFLLDEARGFAEGTDGAPAADGAPNTSTASGVAELTAKSLLGVVDVLAPAVLVPPLPAHSRGEPASLPFSDVGDAAAQKALAKWGGGGWRWVRRCALRAGLGERSGQSEAGAASSPAAPLPGLQLRRREHAREDGANEANAAWTAFAIEGLRFSPAVTRVSLVDGGHPTEERREAARPHTPSATVRPSDENDDRCEVLIPWESILAIYETNPLASDTCAGEPLPPTPSTTVEPTALRSEHRLHEAAQEQPQRQRRWHPLASPSPCDAFVCPLLPRLDAVGWDDTPQLVRGAPSFFIGVRFRLAQASVATKSNEPGSGEYVAVIRCFSVASKRAVSAFLHQQLTLCHAFAAAGAPKASRVSSMSPAGRLARVLPWHEVAQRMADASYNLVCDRVCGVGRAIPPPSTIGSRLVAFMQSLVSRKKRRFCEDGFDLDLTYITPNIIAMGYPASGREALYRNSLDETVRFLEMRHSWISPPSGQRERCYRVYNLCSERWYPATAFGGRFERFPSDDHAPAPLATILGFCESAAAFLSDSAVSAVVPVAATTSSAVFAVTPIEADGKWPPVLDDSAAPPRNSRRARGGDEGPAAVVAARPPARVVAVHCKAGKGRTGVMSVALLLYLGICRDVEGALALYAARRTRNGKGVTIASQRRFVTYFAHMLRQLGGQVPRRRPVRLTLLSLSSAPQLDLDGGCTPFVVVRVRRAGHHHAPLGQREGRCDDVMSVVFDSRTVATPPHAVGDEATSIGLGGVVVSDEVEVVLYSAARNGLVQRRDEYLCSFWFHSSFLDAQAGTLTLRREEIDGASKETKSLFEKSFTLRLEFVALKPTPRVPDPFTLL